MFQFLKIQKSLDTREVLFFISILIISFIILNEASACLYAN